MPFGSYTSLSDSSALLSDSRGQVFEPFKMLIGAVMALTILVIIIGAINYFDGLRAEVSKQRFYDGLSNAVKQPNGETLVIEEIQFQRGDSFSASALARRLNLEEGCVEFSSSDSRAISSDLALATINENIISNVYATCDVGGFSGCEISCEISFVET